MGFCEKKINIVIIRLRYILEALFFCIFLHFFFVFKSFLICIYQIHTFSLLLLTNLTHYWGQACDLQFESLVNKNIASVSNYKSQA